MSSATLNLDSLKVTAGRGVIVVLSVCHESGSVRVTAVHFSCYEILHSPYFSKFLEMVLFGSQARVNLTNMLFVNLMCG